MNAAKYTPGPWEYVPSTENHGPYICSEFGCTIADCYTMTEPSKPAACNGGPSKPILFLGEMADSNARLIAAAPDMLAALEFIVPILHADTSTKGKMDYSVIRAAIAKATGAE